MFAKVDIPTLGIIKNMAYYHCKNCGQNQAVSYEHNISLEPILGEIPVMLEIGAALDAGKGLEIKNTSFQEIMHKIAVGMLVNLGKHNDRVEVEIEN